MMKILDLVRKPADLRAFDLGQLKALAGEARRFLVDAVCRSGGHLGPNLGVVELTIALHRVFDSPRDPIVWDTGHQSYVHKLFTGRRDDFARLRRAGGISGYPSRRESAHDLSENSHATTALSYVDGLAKAFRLRGEHGRVPVAVIGDGAMTGGMAWEALNNLGVARDRPLVIVLNDNTRSYAPTVGGFAEHLARRRAGTSRWSVFAELGLLCTGPVDGHDLTALEDVLRGAREVAVEQRRPVLVHCVTVKGKGYQPAEADAADRMHAVGVIDPETGKAPRAAGAPTWTSTFGDEIAAVAAERPDVVAITAAMLRPVGLHRFATEFPDRVFDVGMAEQHAVTSAAGMAMGGMHPVVAIYATFFNRAFDQALMDVALHRLPVTFVLDRAGVTGEDGASHHGIWDLSLLNLVPGLRIAAPRDASTLRAQLREAVADDTGPTLLRFPKGGVPADIPARRLHGVEVLRDAESPDVLLVAVGAMAAVGVEVAERLADHGIGVTVVDPCWVKPVDPALVRLAGTHRMVVTVEDNLVAGGAGAALAQQIDGVPVRNFGVPQRFLPHGSRAEILANCGLTTPDIAGEILADFLSLDVIGEVASAH